MPLKHIALKSFVVALAGFLFTAAPTLGIYFYWVSDASVGVAEYASHRYELAFAAFTTATLFWLQHSNTLERWILVLCTITAIFSLLVFFILFIHGAKPDAILQYYERVSSSREPLIMIARSISLPLLFSSLGIVIGTTLGNIWGSGGYLFRSGRTFNDFVEVRL